jgi:hypothetical protein
MFYEAHTIFNFTFYFRKREEFGDEMLNATRIRAKVGSNANGRGWLLNCQKLRQLAT